MSTSYEIRCRECKETWSGTTVTHFYEVLWSLVDIRDALAGLAWIERERMGGLGFSVKVQHECPSVLQPELDFVRRHKGHHFEVWNHYEERVGRDGRPIP